MRVCVSRRVWIAVVAAALIVVGCGGAAGSGASLGPSAVRVTDADNGRTVTLARGGRLTVTLASTYWSIAGSSDPAVLRLDGQPLASPGSCPPGVGCGQVTATFTAVGPGRAEVTASRSSCGEALSCTGGAGSYRVAVVVGGP